MSNLLTIIAALLLIPVSLRVMVDAFRQPVASGLCLLAMAGIVWAWERIKSPKGERLT